MGGWLPSIVSELAGVDAASGLLANMTCGEGQMACITHPGSVLSTNQRDPCVSLAAKAFVRAFPRPRPVIDQLQAIRPRHRRRRIAKVPLRLRD